MRRLAELYGVPVKRHVLNQRLDEPSSRIQFLTGRGCFAEVTRPRIDSINTPPMIPNGTMK